MRLWNENLFPIVYLYICIENKKRPRPVVKNMFSCYRGECTVGYQPKVKGLKVKTLGPREEKIIRSQPLIFELFWIDLLVENWSKIANIARNWMKLGQNPIELIVLEALEGVLVSNLI